MFTEELVTCGCAASGQGSVEAAAAGNSGLRGASASSGGGGTGKMGIGRVGIRDSNGEIATQFAGPRGQAVASRALDSVAGYVLCARVASFFCFEKLSRSKLIG